MPKRVAAIDVSHWHSANDAAYLRILRDLGRDIVGVSDPDLRIAKERAERFGTTPFTDYRQMIEATRPEFVQRCLRVQLTKTALSEKPQIRPQDRVVFRRRKVFHRRSSVLVSHARLDSPGTGSPWTPPAPLPNSAPSPSAYICPVIKVGASRGTESLHDSPLEGRVHCELVSEIRCRFR